MKRISLFIFFFVFFSLLINAQSISIGMGPIFGAPISERSIGMRIEFKGFFLSFGTFKDEEESFGGYSFGYRIKISEKNWFYFMDLGYGTLSNYYIKSGGGIGEGVSAPSLVGATGTVNGIIANIGAGIDLSKHIFIEVSIGYGSGSSSKGKEFWDNAWHGYNLQVELYDEFKDEGIEVELIEPELLNDYEFAGAIFSFGIGYKF